MGNKNPRPQAPYAWMLCRYACFLVFISYAAALFFVFCPERAEADYEKGAAARISGDYGKALQEWMVTSDDPRCMTAIGGLYHYGEGLPKDEAKAAEWYAKAAGKGEYRAVAQLAGFSLTGAGGVAQNPGEWRAALEKIEGKDAYADYILASFYLAGHGGAKDIDKGRAILAELVNKKGHGQLAGELERAEMLLADKKAGVMDAGDMINEAAGDRAAFDESYRDRRVVVKGRLNSAERINDYGCVVRIGPAAAPRENIAAVFYDPPRGGTLLSLKPGMTVKISGVYVGNHPFPLGDCAFTMFGCSLAGAVSEDRRP